MSAVDIAITVAFLVLVVLLIQAVNILGHNPHQQIWTHEELTGGQLPPEMTHEAKIALIDRFGLSPSNPRRIWAVIAGVAAFMIVLVWQR